MAGESLNICQIEEKAIAVMSTPDRRVDINQDGASKQIRELAQMHTVRFNPKGRVELLHNCRAIYLITIN
jgi:hypothetical protein